MCRNPDTASVVWWAEFLATDLEVRVRFPTLPDFLRNGRSGTGSTQPRSRSVGIDRSRTQTTEFSVLSHNSERHNVSFD
jgi:hypothetical protein